MAYPEPNREAPLIRVSYEMPSMVGVLEREIYTYLAKLLQQKCSGCPVLVKVVLASHQFGVRWCLGILPGNIPVYYGASDIVCALVQDSEIIVDCGQLLCLSDLGCRVPLARPDALDLAGDELIAAVRQYCRI